jgi:hypothetical protein
MNDEGLGIDNATGKREGGFTTPDAYFVALQQNVLSRTSSGGFTVPDGYFEQAEVRVLQKVKESSRPRLRIIYQRRAFAAMAAAVLLASFLFVFRQSFNANQGAARPVAAIDVSDDEIMEYVEVADIRESRIMDLAFNSTEDKSQKQVEEYLVNNADEQLIIEEL